MDLSKLDGYKSYLGAAGCALLGLYYLWTGDTAHGMEFLMLALSIAGLRNAVQKTVEAKK